MYWVEGLVRAANDYLKQCDVQGVGVGPSHFMTSVLNCDWLRKIWKFSIVPEVEEVTKNFLFQWLNFFQVLEEESKLREFKFLPEKWIQRAFGLSLSNNNNNNNNNPNEANKDKVVSKKFEVSNPLSLTDPTTKYWNKKLTEKKVI
jgi:hypothetical protein